jgi:prepilin signal peptidase PulO-like enzyme (type II secretory pathway)
MLMHRISAAVLWTLAGGVAFAVCAVWIADARSGTVSAWIILPFFWSAAVLAAVGHYLAKWRLPVARYLAGHKLRAGSASVESSS